MSWCSLCRYRKPSDQRNVRQRDATRLVPQADPLPGPSSLVLLMQRMELIDPLELRSADGGMDLEGH
jgi:hypothetical protein